MRAQQPEVYAPEFATLEQIEAAAGRLVEGVEGVEVLRTYEDRVQPYDDQGRIDPDANPVAVRGSQLVTVYHVETQVADDPGVRDRFRSQGLRSPQPARVDQLKMAQAASARIVDDPYRRAGYHFDDNSVNVSPQGARCEGLRPAPAHRAGVLRRGARRRRRRPARPARRSADGPLPGRRPHAVALVRSSTPSLGLPGPVACRQVAVQHVQHPNFP